MKRKGFDLMPGETKHLRLEVDRRQYSSLVREAGGTLPEAGTQVVEVVPGPVTMPSALRGAWRRARARSLVLGHPGGAAKGTFSRSRRPKTGGK